MGEHLEGHTPVQLQRMPGRGACRARGFHQCTARHVYVRCTTSMRCAQRYRRRGTANAHTTPQRNNDVWPATNVAGGNTGS